MPRLKSTKGKKIRSKTDKDKQLSDEKRREIKIGSKIGKALGGKNKEAGDFAEDAIGLLAGMESTNASASEINACQACNAKCAGNSKKCKKCKKKCENVDPNDQEAPVKISKRRSRVISEPIPDYIMRALQPKKSVHPEYGKLRY